MPSLKEYKNRLVSLKNTRKMTKTMKMVAMSKLTKAVDAQRKASIFSARVHELISHLMASVEQSAHPLFEVRLPPRRTLFIVITSDRGMCGGFNNNLLRFAERHFLQLQKVRHDFELRFFGRKGHMAFRKKFPSGSAYEGDSAKPLFSQASRIAADAATDFTKGAFDEVNLVYNSFISPISQKPQIQKLLPIDEGKIQPGEHRLSPNFIFEPPRAELLSMLIPKIVEFEVYYALLVNAAGENSARVTAMDNATRNADAMIDRYTLLRNRARQAVITNELIEIISGAEGLKNQG